MQPTVRRPGPVSQSVVSPTADPGVASLIPAQSHSLVEIDHEIISTSSPSADSRRIVVSYKSKYWYVHEVLRLAA